MDNATMISRIQKAKEYAEEPKRVTFNALSVEFRGDNSSYTTSLAPEGWHCTCPGFQSYGICPHVMALEKMLTPMLKRDPTPYAAGQNIVSDVKKAKRYSEETDRIRFKSFDAQFQGRNRDNQLTYQNDKWTCTCTFFKSYQVCSHNMAMERMLDGMVELASTARAEIE